MKRGLCPGLWDASGPAETAPPGSRQGKGLPLDSLCCPQEGSNMSMEAATLPLEITPTHEDAAPSHRAGPPQHPLTRS